MNQLAETMVPTDDQLRCYHMIGLSYDSKRNPVILNMGDADLIKTLGGIAFTFCPLCGGRLEE